MKLQPQNGFLIKPYRTDSRDKELIRIIPFLVFLSDLDDVRIVRDWSKTFITEEEIDYTNILGEMKTIQKTEFIKYIVQKLHNRYLNFPKHYEFQDPNSPALLDQSLVPAEMTVSPIRLPRLDESYNPNSPEL